MKNGREKYALKIMCHSHRIKLIICWTCWLQEHSGLELLCFLQTIWIVTLKILTEYFHWYRELGKVLLQERNYLFFCILYKYHESHWRSPPRIPNYKMELTNPGLTLTVCLDFPCLPCENRSSFLVCPLKWLLQRQFDTCLSVSVGSWGRLSGSR